VFIPKPDGRLRPLGVAALEDKILQRAVVEVLNAIYETDFLGFSYGFRPGRSPHHALDALAAGIVGKKVNWVLDADFSDYFSSLDHQWLLKFLEHRIADRRVLRLVQKWLASLDSVQVQFDDKRLISDAGLLLCATLADRLGIEELVNESVWLGHKVPGAALPGRKVMTLVHGMLAGADSIDDMNVLRAAA
jgi:hypothetical protein